MSIAEKFEVIADAVYEKGKRVLAKSITDNGTRTYYYRAFQTSAFEEDADFYGLCKPVTAGYMFYNQTGKYLPKGVDLSNIDVSAALEKNANLYAWGSKILEIPDYNMPALEIYNVTYGYCYSLHTIQGKIKVNKNTEYSSTFTNCTELANIELEGTIGQNGFNVQWSKKLTKASLLSILTALSNDSSIATGKSITFSTVHKDIIEGDAECLEQYNLAISAGWTIAYA